MLHALEFVPVRLSFRIMDEVKVMVSTTMAMVIDKFCISYLSLKYLMCTT